MGATIAGELIDRVSGAEGLVLLAIVLGIVFAESAVLLDFFVPGEVGLVVAGAAAAQNGTPLPGVIAAAALGAIAGDSVGWVIGRRFGTDLAERSRFARWLGPGLKRARTHFDRRGGATVAVARFVGALRAVVPVVAGSAGLPYRRFVLWAFPAAVAWSAAMASVGYVWGDDIADVIDRAGLAVSAVVVLVIVVLLVRAHCRRSTERSDDGQPDRDERRPAAGAPVRTR